MNCRICNNSNLKKFLSLGVQPLANSFLSKDQLNDSEPKFPLELCFCEHCKLVQLSYAVEPEKMFRNYFYVSSTTKTFVQHFTGMAESITREFHLGKDSLAVDIGSNDGLLVRAFKNQGVMAIGIEPAENLARMANQEGAETINDFFSEKSAEEILRRKGKADIITANNVFAHINDIHEAARNVKMLLKDNGAYIIEVQYMADMLEKMTFDNVYHEHLSYYTLISLRNFFEKQGMRIFRAERVDTHGGSIRVYAALQGSAHREDPSVEELLRHEKSIGADKCETYTAFADKVNGTKKKLTDCLREIREKGKKTAGYGAPAKSSTLLNFCGIGRDEIEFIIEDNPMKVGLFTPGTHIPIKSPVAIEEQKPDYILILAWNFATEILSKTTSLRDKGTKFIIPLPNLRIE